MNFPKPHLRILKYIIKSEAIDVGTLFNTYWSVGRGEQNKMHTTTLEPVSLSLHFGASKTYKLFIAGIEKNLKIKKNSYRRNFFFLTN